MGRPESFLTELRARDLEEVARRLYDPQREGVPDQGMTLITLYLPLLEDRFLRLDFEEGRLSSIREWDTQP
jgi:hypothetical protein